ncbi:hypothetical protein [Flavobacterium selenitireducens]|uniref:hypothetical protein n=1 Tax=Flavobacterium selenitireducens TaxID=2722704 RepID=UPI00168AB40B|nr:hypothetical protein [Flavobacterium selenitireducens]MBD3583516.1 hypothetical protein [Flavobacterium selenitireducens]
MSIPDISLRKNPRIRGQKIKSSIHPQTFAHPRQKNKLIQLSIRQHMHIRGKNNKPLDIRPQTFAHSGKKTTSRHPSPHSHIRGKKISLFNSLSASICTSAAKTTSLSTSVHQHSRIRG